MIRGEGAESLLELIKSKKAVVGVIGLGYVGVPLLIKFAEAGFKVKGIDKDQDVIDALEKGKSLWPHVTHTEIQNQMKNKDKNFSLFPVKWKYKNTSEEIRKEIASCDVYVICVPTPLKHSSICEPNLDYIDKAAEIVEYSIGVSQRKLKLVILESTTYPGCTEEVILLRLKRALSGFPGYVNLVYSPERTNPGGEWPFTEIPKIVGGMDEASFELAYELYKPLFADGISKVGSMKIAETIKCAENTYRLLSISFANKLAQLLKHSDVNIWHVIETAKRENTTLNSFFPRGLVQKPEKDDTEFFKEILKHNNLSNDVLSDDTISIDSVTQRCVDQICEGKAPRLDQQAIHKVVTQSFCQLTILLFYQLAKFCTVDSMRMSIREIIDGILTKPFGLDMCYPGPGTGGHCIPIDPLYLYWKAKEEGIDIPLIWEAFHIDEGMPDEIVRMIRSALHIKGKKLSGSNILMLGVTYKENVPDLRESKAAEILKYLLSQDAKLFYCDPVFTRRQAELYPERNQWKKREYYLEILKPATPDIPEAYEGFYLNERDLNKCVAMVGKGEIDCVVIFVDHNDFSDHKVYEQIVSNKNVPIIDTRNAIERKLKRIPENVIVLGRYGTPLKHAFMLP